MTDPVFEIFNEVAKHRGNLTSTKDTDILLALMLLELRKVSHQSEVHWVLPGKNFHRTDTPELDAFIEKLERLPPV